MANGSGTSRPYAGLPQNTADDRERARELYKYFRPPVAVEPIDTVLTAHAQLTAWRLNAERAMISLIDEETQYFVAESTKTVHLDDADQYDDPEDAIWAGCVRVPKAGRLCEHTIAALPPSEGGPACFEVLDLSKDERFNQLDFIAGPPSFKYYAGVPLRTRKGINIGSIYILDSKLRAALTRNEKHFLGVMADNVIQHLEMSRDKKDRRRAFRMNECLSAYVDPASEYAKSRRRYSNHSQSTDPDSDAECRRTTDGNERMRIIARAADMLREAMDIEEGGGGVLYLDTSLAVSSQRPSSCDRRSSKVSITGNLVEESLSSWQQSADSESMLAIETHPRSPTLTRESKITSGTDILAHTYQPIASSTEQPEFVPFRHEDLIKIIKRFPRGRLFTYDEQGQELSDFSDSDSLYTGGLRSKRRQKRYAAESAILRAHFPEARQIMFVPIWDSTTSRSGACFVYNCSEYRNFSHQLEFLNCIAFNNCVDTELLRLANLKTTEQKNDFIGSISHELRSPLHGILASCEFLQGTICTSFQESLVRTAESCANTLLDTVNMVLDYSKINAFERNETAGATPGPDDDVSLTHSEAFQTSLNTHRNVDLAILVEEVVEGVAAGHLFSNPQSQVLHHEPNFDGKPTNGTVVTHRKSNVELIVEISEQDWIAWCEPGTIRRIVMNIVSNSIKYTKVGFVRVKLELENSGPNATEYGVLTVIDSGQGMSPAYLKDKLYTPFAQESNQAPGFGLGLSLVKSIVGKIGGHINIESAIGVGTKATVRFPLTRKLASIPKAKAGATTRVASLNNGIDDKGSTQRISSSANGTSIAMYHQEMGDATGVQQEASKLLRETLTAYLKAWTGNTVIEWQENCTADIVIVEDHAFDALTQSSPSLLAPGCRTVILVMRSTGSAESGVGNNIEDVRHPIGPQKLSRAVQACLDRSRAITQPSVTKSATPIESLTAVTAQLEISIEPSPNPIQTSKPNEVQSAGDHTDSTEPKPPPKTNKPLNTTLTSTISPAQLPQPPTCPVLLVDDNTINLRLLQVSMKKRGYTSITSASNGQIAVSTYRTLLASSPAAAPAIILMDLSMPIMNGFEATRRIREIEAEYNNSHAARSRMPLRALIIALTGLASVRDQKEAFTAGVDEYVMKPVSFKKLTALLEGWVAGNKTFGAEGVREEGAGVV